MTVRGGYVDANFTIQCECSERTSRVFRRLKSVHILQKFMQTTEEIMISINLLSYSKDPESDAITFSHNYNNADGEIKFFNPSDGTFIFEPKSNFANVVVLEFNATDPANNKRAFKVNITVAEVADPPVVYKTGTPVQLGYPNVFQIGNFVENNGTLVADLNASDPNDNPPSTSFLWTLSGSDASKFTLDPNQGPVSQLKFLKVPDFEKPESSDGDNTYEFNMTVQDEGNATVIPVKILVNNGSEDPYFYGQGWEGITNLKHNSNYKYFKQVLSYPEGKSYIVFDVNASDEDNSTIIYGLTTDSLDNSKFNIDSTTGEITFKSVPDYETVGNQMGHIPNSSTSTYYGVPINSYDLNTTYVIEVNATDDVNQNDKIRHYIYVTVTNIIEAPQFEGTNFTSVGSVFTKDVQENASATGSGFDLNVTTEDINSSLILEISGGSDADKFSLNVATNNLHWKDPNGQDFENPASANGDNSYEVQVRIVGTSITQDYIYTVINQNDSPVISTTDLTQLTLDENIPFVINLEALDQDGGGEYPDILYTVDSNSSRFIEHNNSATDKNNLFNNSGSDVIDLSLDDASFSTFGDLNNDGILDVLVLGTTSINYFEGTDKNGNFDKNVTNALTSNSVAGIPDHAVICDLDQDGDKDVLVSLVASSKIEFYNNSGGLTIGSFSKSTIVNDVSRQNHRPEFFVIGDVDNDYDLDLIVAYQTGNEVVWYANDGNSTFTEGA